MFEFMSNKDEEKKGVKWWLHLVIAILSAIAGAVGGSLVVAPFITNL